MGITHVFAPNELQKYQYIKLGGKVEMHVASLKKKKKSKFLVNIRNHSLNKNKVLFKVENKMDFKLHIA